MKKLFTTITGLAMLSLSACTLLQSQGSPSSSGKPSSAMAKLHFPKHWIDATRPNEPIDDIPLSFIQQMEVRRAPNSAADEFLFAALPNGDNDYRHEVDRRLPKPQYSMNFFAVKLSSPLQVRPATNEEWESGARVPTKMRYAFSQGKDDASGEIAYRHRHYAKTGKYWGGGSVSPTGKWIAVFSYSGFKWPALLPFSGPTAKTGDIFWEVYDTVTGKKVFEWEGKNAQSPASLGHPVAWLEDRYFLFPVDEHAQDMIVVTLPPVTPEENPVTIRLPARKDSSSQPVPAPSTNEAWTPLAPLTKEQAAKITAPSETEIAEVRWTKEPLELLFAIKEETANRNENRHRPDGGADYNYRQFSTCYYAVPLDNASQARAVEKQEWDRATVLRSYPPNPSPGEGSETSSAAIQRLFPKTGNVGGSPLAVSIGEWVAVFSYNEIARDGANQNAFVDLYNQRTRDKFLSTTVPINGPPNDLFRRARGIDGGYIILPLSPALDSFALWRLPE